MRWLVTLEVAVPSVTGLAMRNDTSRQRALLTPLSPVRC